MLSLTAFILTVCRTAGPHNWRTGKTFKWKASGRKLNHEERERADAEIKATKAEREADKADRHAKAAAETRRILDHETSPAPSDHPYLVKKGIRAHGARIYTGDDPRWRDCLVIQVMRGDQLVGLQFIGPDGNKRLLPGTQKKGAYFLLGVPDGKLGICEGYATGVTVHEDTGYAVAVAFDAHNLIHVARAFEGFPGEVIICADNDASRVNSLTGLPENIGLIRATEAARATGAKIAIPSIDGDFNAPERRRCSG
jgi:putative DNA primase/helicase